MTKRLVDFVAHTQFRQPQHSGLPERENFQPQDLIDIGNGTRAGRHKSPPVEQVRDTVDNVEHRLAANLGGMCRHNRAHRHGAQRVGDVIRGCTAAEQAFDGIGHRSRSGTVTGVEMRAPAAFGMDIFGCVGQKRKPAECSNQVQGIVDRDGTQTFGKVGDWGDAGATLINCNAPYFFDEVERVVTGLLADDVT